MIKFEFVGFDFKRFIFSVFNNLHFYKKFFLSTLVYPNPNGLLDCLYNLTFNRVFLLVNR